MLVEEPEVDTQQVDTSLQSSSGAGVGGSTTAAPPHATNSREADLEASVPGTPPSSPTPQKLRARQDSISGGDLANPPFFQPESGFPSPASGVAAAEDVLRRTMVEDDYNSDRRRSTRKGTGPQRDQLFRRRLKQQRHRDMLFELRQDGTYEMKEMTIREVFNYVQDIVAPYAVGSGLSPKSAVDLAQQQQRQQQQQGQEHISPPSRPLSARSTPPRNALGKLDGSGNRDGGDSHGRTRMRRSESISAGVPMSSLNLHLRDMRQLFSYQAKSEPAISVRRNCVLVNFETLRGIVLVDRILLVVDPGADSILMEVRKAVNESHDDVYEFELKALEALLSVSSKRLEREVREVEQPIAAIVHTLEGSGKGATSAKNNDRFRGFLNSINVLENRAKARRRALLMVLEDDTDLAMMNLTRMYQSPEDYLPPLSTEVLEDHEEVELLLEAYLQDINSIYNVLELLQGRARSTEALVMVKLDIARNRILTAGLIFSMASTCLTLGALVSGIFGMNLANGSETSVMVFRVVAIATACVITIGFCGLSTFFYRHGLLVT
ncbi:unnamed protein product [Pylaiella littoralis]